MLDSLSSVAKESKELSLEVYKDCAQPTVKVVGTTLGRLVNSLIAPVRGLCWSFEKIEKCVFDGLEKRLAGKKEDELHTPDPRIAVPLLQSLTYSAQEDELRERYLDLLASSCEDSKINIAHPSFVTILNEMNCLDALLLKKLCVSVVVHRQAKLYKLLTSESITMLVNGQIKTEKVYTTNYMPDYYVPAASIREYSLIDISASLIRLAKDNLITLEILGVGEIKSAVELLSTEIRLRELNEIEMAKHNNYSLSMRVGILEITNCGKQFADCCLPR